MLRIIAVLLLAMWLVGVLMFKTLGALIHLFLVLGVVVLLLGFIRGRRGT